MANRTVLVTGGAGYIGAHCCKAFARAGWNVVVYDNLSHGCRDLVRWGPLVEGDVLDRVKLAQAMVEFAPNVVVHFAALTSVRDSVARPDIYYQNNTIGTLNVLNAARSANVEAFLFSSTGSTYGVPRANPIDESHPQVPISPYGWSKLFAERMLIDFDAAFGMRFAIFRYFNAAGADPDCEIGERHDPETHLIPLALRGAMAGDYTLNIFGSDFETRDGTCVRDYVHVADLAAAHLKALEYLDAGSPSDAFNLGTGTGTTVLEIAEAVERVSGAEVRRVFAPRRAGDPAALIASADKARRILGWAPERSDIETIVRDAWRWHQFDWATTPDRSRFLRPSA